MPPSGHPWSVKGIDPRARAIAKSAARREGLTLGEWLNRVILDDESDGSPGWDEKLSDFPGFGSGGGGGEDDGALQDIVQRLAGRLEAAERRSALALSGVDQSVLGLSRRLEALEDEREEESGEVETALARTRAAQDELLERIRKLEKSGPGADGTALKAVETALGKLAARLYETETGVRGELDTLALKEERRREGSEKGLKSVQQRLEEAERKFSGEDRAIREQLDARHRETQSGLENLQGATRSLQQRLTAAEGATHRAAELLGQSHERLEARLKAIETRSGDAVSREEFKSRFDSLAGELAEVIRATRNDFARQIEQAVRQDEGGALRQTLEQAEARIARAEQRQSDQLSRIGEQIAKLSRAMEKRLEETDRRLEARLTEAERGRRQSENQAAIEARLSQVREENASAVKRMGEEVAKLGNSLADRVQQAEQRSADAMQAAGERMARVVEKLQHRNPGAEQDLQARISASEERTAKRIEDAMGKLHARLDEARTEHGEALTPVQRAMTALAERLEAIEKRGGETAGSAPQKAEAAPDFSKPLPVPPGLEKKGSGEEDFEIVSERDGFVVEAENAPAKARKPKPKPAPAPSRAAALGATADSDFLNTARDTARTSRPARGDYRFDPAGEETGGGRGRWVLIGASVLSFLIIGAAAALLIVDSLAGERMSVSRVEGAGEDMLGSLFAEAGANAATATPAPRPQDTGLASEPAAEPVSEPARRAEGRPAEPRETAAAGAAQAGPAVIETASASAPASLEDAAASGDAVARYLLALQHLEAGELDEAAVLMRRAAEQNIPAAQFRYGQMLQRGEGVTADPERARLWMVRAAQNGNVRAMHAAGAMFINAGATPENQEAAAHWFEQAALHGVSDSQFNLALLFQSGYGVPESPADAYAWLLIASAGGDAAAAQRAGELRRELSVEQRNAAERVAESFTPRPIDPEAQGRYPAFDGAGDMNPALVLRAQTLLADLGYDAGPADGDFGPQTREAIVAYQSDQGLEPTGRVDSTLVARLEQSASR